MAELPKALLERKGVRVLDDEVLDGFELNDIKCRSCSGYGNCGYKSYFLSDGGVVSVCWQRRRQMQCKRDGVPYDPSDL